jgi:hypothetical protein
VAAGAFACGVAPLLAYYVGHRLSLLPPGTGASPETVESYLTQLIVRGLPQILGSIRASRVRPTPSAMARWPHRLRLNRVYGGSNLWPYLSDRRVLAAHPTSERMIELAQEVDAATRVGWVLRPPTEAFGRRCVLTTQI